MNTFINHLCIALVTLFVVSACGINKTNRQSESTVLSVSKVEKAADPVPEDANDEIEGPTFLSGPCDNEIGCINGFISHGHRIKIAPEKRALATGFKNYDGNVIEMQSYVFKDAQDFGDSFTRAFVEPLADPNKLDSISFKVVPRVERDNFAVDFKLYAEGLNASDGSVQMMGQGNFSLGSIDPYDKVFLRAVKMFRIEATIDLGDGSQQKKVTCLEISYTKGPLVVEAGDATKIGGLSNFFFYYTASKDLCSDERLGITYRPFDNEEGVLDPVSPDLF